MNEIKVLDKGFARLESHIGGDEAVVRAARVCYGSQSRSQEDDKKLINYLLKHEHGTPFEHNSFTFHVKVPLFVARQWHRHRIGVSYNEVSARYTEMKDEFYIPKWWRKQDTVNKQGSVAGELQHIHLEAECHSASQAAMKSYRFLLDNGAAKEMARMVLPTNLYTEFYFTCNARSLMAFIKLRSEQHAQWEIRQYSNALWRLFVGKMPWTAEAFLSTLDMGKYTNGQDGIAGPNHGDVEVANAR